MKGNSSSESRVFILSATEMQEGRAICSQGREKPPVKPNIEGYCNTIRKGESCEKRILVIRETGVWIFFSESRLLTTEHNQGFILNINWINDGFSKETKVSMTCDINDKCICLSIYNIIIKITITIISGCSSSSSNKHSIIIVAITFIIIIITTGTTLL